MKLKVARKFDKVMLDRENLSDFMKFIYEDLERQLYEGLMDKLKDHKPHAVRLSEPTEPITSEGAPGTWWPECEVKQDLICIDLVQCENCRMVYPWCQKFRDELGGKGFCPYGKEYEDA